MPITPAGLEFVKNQEGFRATAYQDAGGLWTIGYGQRCNPADYPAGITEAAATELLEAELNKICAGLLPGLYNFPYQSDALCSLIYNIGQTAFSSSALSRALLAKEAYAFVLWASWVHDGSKVLEGLIRRRNAEMTLYIWGSYAGR